ncbi:MAG: biotin-dependent carboxyltransferase family protein [Paracoccaceae bacterium]
MTDASLRVAFAGPHVTVQDAGRPGLMRFGVPASGPLDRLAFAAANLAVGNPQGAPCIEVSMGGLTIDCTAGAVGFAVAGGGFIVDHAGQKRGSWTVATLRAGERLVIRPGPWGSWCYLALAGEVQATRWLGSAATHGLSGFGGGRLVAGCTIAVTQPRSISARDIPCPVIARPRHRLHVTLGPQDRFFAPETLAAFLSGPWRMTDAWDRMGVRLAGPRIAPAAALDMPSEPIMRGSVQVAGDGVATVLLADHQTTGGYPKIATVLDAELDAMAQLRPRDPVEFAPLSPTAAIQVARTARMAAGRYLATLARTPG